MQFQLKSEQIQIFKNTIQQYTDAQFEIYPTIIECSAENHLDMDQIVLLALLAIAQCKHETSLISFCNPSKKLILSDAAQNAVVILGLKKIWVQLNHIKIDRSNG